MQFKKLCKQHLIASSIPLLALIICGTYTTTVNADNVDWAIEEITVTARKRSESLQNTPIAISVFDGDGLEARGIDNLMGVAKIAPNMSFQNNPSFGGASNAASIYIRGVGQKEFLPTTEPGVGLYVDGIYIARSIGAILNLVDVEQVEILRGPQGTLFGRNTIGGAIIVTTIKPTDDFGGNLEATIGIDNMQRAKVHLNVPLMNNLLSKFSLASMKQDGYVKRPDGTNLGDDNTLTGRATFLWSPNNSVEALLSVEISRDRENGPPMTLLDINLGNTIDPDTPPFAVINNVGANQAAGGGAMPCATPNAPINLAVPGCYDLRYRIGDSKNAGTAPAFSETDLKATSLNISWDINKNLTLKSITAWRDLDSKFARDGDHSPLLISAYHDTLEQQQFTQEFQLLGSSFDNSLNWIIGLYFFDEEGDNVNTLDFVVSSFQSGGKFSNTSKAIFSQATWDISDQWSLTAGLRYTSEDKSFLPDQFIITNYFAGSGNPMLDAPFLQVGERILPFLEKDIDISESTAMVDLSYQWTNDLMTYISYSEGFKSGGFTQRVFPPQIAGTTAAAGTADIDLIPDFDPEFADAYEMGFKYTGLEGRLRLNGALFHTEYDDLQVQVFTSVAPVTKNAASAKITGWEMEATYIPAESWVIEASYGWVNARYDEIDFNETFIDKSNAFERVPKSTGSLAISKEFNFSSSGSVLIRLDGSYRAREFMDAANTPVIAQDSYYLLNASATWYSLNNRWNLRLNLNNITDEDYLITGVIGDAMQSYEGIFFRSQKWSLTARYTF